jgi:acetyl CoA:N6-hydroxylysine acetyl transferase
MKEPINMLPTLKEVIYSPLSQKDSFKASLAENELSVKSSSDKHLNAKVSVTDETLHLETADDSILVMVGLEYLLGHIPEIKKIELTTALPLLGKSFLRSEFFQLPTLWHHQENYVITPEKWMETDGRPHPVRAPHHQGVFYRRYLPHLEKTVTFRLTNIEKDLDIFHEWHNSPRVSFFWELNQSKEELKDYMEKGLKKPHQIPMLVEMDGEALGYYEMYWVPEDRLGPYYDHDAFDRGFHFLIGNKKFLGYNITDSVIKSGLHLLFLDEARTRRIMAEPRHDNQKVLKYAEASIGWKKLKEFDFPHKRAALLENSREIFFGGNAL